MVNVFIVGSKGIPAQYGGFETFVENLTKRRKKDSIKYFVSCMGGKEIFEHNNALCFPVPLVNDSSVNRIINVSNALNWVEKYLASHPKEKNNIVYILGCRVGLLMYKHRRKLAKLGCIIISNPDGLEWKRDKWNWWQKKVLLASEKKLIKNSDYVICDSVGIKDYVEKKYKTIGNKVGFIAYGSDVSKSKCNQTELEDWLDKFSVKPNEYYLVVGRFVPENNYELILKEFLKTNTSKKLLIISNVEKNSFYERLLNNVNFTSDKRIVFAGTLYNEQLLKKIRENCTCYIHGHSVGGTNPSLLEALASSKINLLYDVIFNKEVGADQCLYFSNKEGDLSKKINDIEQNYQSFINELNPSSIIEKKYNWPLIIDQYENCFLSFFKSI